MESEDEEQDMKLGQESFVRFDRRSRKTPVPLTQKSTLRPWKLGNLERNFQICTWRAIVTLALSDIKLSIVRNGKSKTICDKNL